MRRIHAFALLVVLAAIVRTAPAAAHALAFGALELREGDDGSLTCTLRVAGDVEGGPGLRVGPPSGCAPDGAFVSRARAGGGLEGEGRFRCAGTIAGGEVRVEGLAGSELVLRARLVRRDGTAVEAMLDRAHPALAIPEAPEASAPLTHAVRLGVEHLVTGVDHVLFVLGLVALIRRPRALVAALTAFTLGHSVTLALATLGLTSVRAAPVELWIALSLVLVARELALDEAGSSLARRRPALVAGLVGLVHGLGFAGALAGVGVAGPSLARTLVGFNVGLELGQLALVAALLALGRLARRAPRLERAALRALPYALGAIGVFLALDRARLLGAP